MAGGRTCSTRHSAPTATRPEGRKPQHPVASHDLAPGWRLPAYCTAIGKALLASLPAYQQRALIGEMQLRQRTASTITSKTVLRAELKLIAQEGLAFNDQEDTPGVHAIAAPIRDEREVTAAISISAPVAAITLQDMVEHLTPHLLATASRISARLGHRRADEQHLERPQH